MSEALAETGREQGATRRARRADREDARERVAARLPVFPLGTVLFPGLVLPLHIFEERYRTWCANWSDDRRGPQEFGEVKLRHGWEVTRARGRASARRRAGGR